MCGLDSDIVEIKQMLRKMSENLDRLLEEKETDMAMAFSEHSLKRFLEEEPDIYSVKDIKVKN